MTDVPLRLAELVELIACPAPDRSLRPLGEMAYRVDGWTPGETATLRRLFDADQSLAEIAASLGRGAAGVTDRSVTLGLRRHSTRAWSELEDAALARDYGREPAADIAARLGRSCTAVYARAALFGLSEAGSPRWTAWEDRQLREGYAQGLPIAQIATLIGRPFAGLASRASALGLKHPNHPKGWSEAEAARALELVGTGLRYLAVIDQLAAEGYPRRTKAAFNPKLRKLGYGRGWGRPWTAEEDALLVHLYATGASLTPLRARLDRTQHSIRWRADYLNLRGTHANKNGFRSGPDWTEADIATLRSNYGKMPSAVLAAKLGRTKAAMFTRANLLGLVHGYFKPWTAEHVTALTIAFDHGIAIADLSVALDRKPMSVSKYATKHGFEFGRRARSPKPLKLPDIMALHRG